MSIKTIFKRLKKPNEYFYLQVEQSGLMDEIGNLNKQFVDVKKLNLVLQEADNKMLENHGLKQIPHGREERIRYFALIIPDFEAPPIGKLGNYRIKHLKNDGSILYYEILRFDRNLILRGKIHHYEAILELNNKWFSTSQSPQ